MSVTATRAALARINRCAMVTVLTALNAWVWYGNLRVSREMAVWFLDVGQGDAIAVVTPAGHVLLVDTGRRLDQDDMGRRVVMPFLRSQGIGRVDALLLTHPDEDHVGGASTVLEREDTRRLLISGIRSEGETYVHVLSSARRHGVPIIRLVRGQALDFRDGVTADVLNPSPLGDPSPNNGCVVVRVRYGSTSVLLTGDAEQEAEAEMMAACSDVHADLLKVGHHGSLTSTSAAFLDAVHPAAAVISVGQHNPFGHPHPTVLARMAARHIPVFRTDRNGAVLAISDGRGLHISAVRGLRF